MNNNIKKSIFIAPLTIFVFIIYHCKPVDCEYITEKIINPACNGQKELNINTGLNANDSLIKSGLGVVDPNWRLINRPPLTNCDAADIITANSINGNAYVVNISPGNTGWVNQVGSSVISPVDIGDSKQFNCNNAKNTKNKTIPYILERPFCLLENTCINFDFSFKGDDQVYFEIYNNTNNSVVKTSTTYIWTTTPSSSNWKEQNLCLNAGSYSLRAYLTNTNSKYLGFSLIGKITESSGKNVISKNKGKCCENNVISILNILEEKGICNGSFDGNDKFGNGWTFNIKDQNGTVIKSGQSDDNGNLIFSGLPDGDYKVEIISQTGWTPNATNIPVNISNNAVSNITFYNCIK